MPHSSGGGSHGGGSHGGSFRGSSGGARISNTYFSGARRFYTYSDKIPKYIYSKFDVTKKPSKLRLLLLFFYLPFIAAILWLCTEIYHVPKPVEVDYADTEIFISDELNIIQDTTPLLNTLHEFYEKTGITACVITTANENWKIQYRTLSDYAYDLYVNRFKDEKHWLIVYTQPEIIKEGEFIDWYWEAMQGDDTDDVITEKMAGLFTDLVQQNLSAGGRYFVDEAIKDAFDNLNAVIMEPRFSAETLLACLFVALFIGIHMFLLVFFDPYKKYRNYKECAEDAAEIKCSYCDGIYLSGTSTNCPHCGAPPGMS